MNNQKGSVLLWGTVLLLAITTFSVVGARMALVDSRITNNQAQMMLTYQGAESALNLSTTLGNMVDAASKGGETKIINQDINTPDGVVKAETEIEMSEETTCPPIESVAMSTGSGLSCRMFSIRSTSWLVGTGANSLHEAGVLRYAPTVQ